MRLSGWFGVGFVSVIFGFLGCMLGVQILSMRESAKPLVHQAEQLNNDGVSLPFAAPPENTAPAIDVQ